MNAEGKSKKARGKSEDEEQRRSRQALTKKDGAALIGKDEGRAVFYFLSFAFCLFTFAFLVGCAARPRGPLAYVTNERDGTITVIDTATDRVVSTFNVGGRLRGVRVGSDGARVYVAASTPSGKNYDPKENHAAAGGARGGAGLGRSRGRSYPGPVARDA